VNSQTIELITNELASRLQGCRFGKVFQLSRLELAMDLRLTGPHFLYINVSPSAPRLYLINRRLKDVERSSGNPSPFALSLKKWLSGAVTNQVTRWGEERIVGFRLSREDEFGSVLEHRLIAQLTGRSANLFLVREDGVIIDRLRETLGDGQQPGDIYQPPRPEQRTGDRPRAEDIAAAESEGSVSETLDRFYLEREAELAFANLAKAATARLDKDQRKRERLLSQLNADLAGHGDPENWKRLGDLLLANAAAARREGENFIVIDLFDEAAPEIAIAADADLSPTEAAEQYYRRYTRARNARSEVAGRIEVVSSELEELKEKRKEIETAIAYRDEDLLNSLAGAEPKPAGRQRAGNEPAAGGVRRFLSSDGFEILVGKKATDNDHLTFRLAKSLDTWMHAADYPGSHVVVRNPNRGDIPHRTLLEAAKLAAFYSQGKVQTKAAVHYTPKKFVNKPKGAPPGLVSLASFKTLLVEPEFPGSVKRK
jgi:predicted ribosome quality control (RQC) complex YloA/Tae2 family protein